MHDVLATATQDIRACPMILVLNADCIIDVDVCSI